MRLTVPSTAPELYCRVSPATTASRSRRSPGSYHGSTRYGGAHHANLLFSESLPEPAAPTTVIVFDPDRHRHIDRLTWAAAAA